MEYVRHGRCLIPLGSLFDNLNSAVEFVENLAEEKLSIALNSIEFASDKEGYLRAIIGDQSYFISFTALKDLCKWLKLPSGFINKFPITRMILSNLNDNPYLEDDPHPLQFIIWKWEEHAVIAGILPQDSAQIPVKEFLQAVQTEGGLRSDVLKIESVIITGEEIALYYLLNEEVAQEGFSFTPGFGIHYSPTRAADTKLFPFYQMSVTTSTGEIFDFDFESPKMLHAASRRKKDFEAFTLQLATQYEGEDLGVDLENTIKRGLAARNLSEVKFSLLKLLKSRTTSIFGYGGMKVKSGAILEEIIPEYKQFIQENQELIKEREKYELNTILVNFYIPLFCNRLFTFRANSENPYYFLRYRKTIGQMFDKILEEAGDLILEK